MGLKIHTSGSRRCRGSKRNKTSQIVQFRKEHHHTPTSLVLEPPSSSGHHHTNKFIASNTLQTLNHTRNLQVTGCDDNASALDAEAHADDHLWTTTSSPAKFLNSIFRMVPDVTPVGLANAYNTCPSKHLAST